MESNMQHESTKLASLPAAQWLSPSPHTDSIESAAATLPGPDTGFAYAILCWLLAGGVVLPLVGLLWLTKPGLTECQTAPLALQLGGQTTVAMKVASGMACTLSAQIGSASLDAPMIDTLPQHGRVSFRGRSGVMYRADPAYKGSDFFAIKLRGRSNSEPGAMTVGVNVAVR
jgi:hypothetical protein